MMEKHKKAMNKLPTILVLKTKNGMCDRVDGLLRFDLEQNLMLPTCEVLGWALGEDVGSKGDLRLVSSRIVHLRA